MPTLDRRVDSRAGALGWAPALVVAALVAAPAATWSTEKVPARDIAAPAHRVITLDTFREVAARVNAGVVNVSTSRIVRRDERSDTLEDFMERFFGVPRDRGPRRQRSLGSGFVIDRSGHILTNRHVIEAADEIEVEFPDGGRYRAAVVGRDRRTDVALLKVESDKPLTVLAMGDSDRMAPGEWVIAVGNPFGFSNSVTAGVVSYQGRPLTLGAQGTSVAMLQTDASINPGNSGGPLLNLAGEVVGINTMMVTRGFPQSAGVGFAVPINVAKTILPQLRETGHVARGWLGAGVQALDRELARTLGLEEPRGAAVTEVAAGSPAERAGLRPGDVVLSVDGKPIEDVRALSDTIATLAPGTTVRLQVRRSGSDRTLPVTLGTFPEEAGPERRNGRGSAAGPLGIALSPLTPDRAEAVGLPRGTTGLRVDEVEAGKPAEAAGLVAGDVVLSVNGTQTPDVASFQAAIDRARREGGLARIRVRREGGSLFLVVRVSP